MSAPATAVRPPARTLYQRAMTLGGANAFDYAMQFLLPLVLVRCLTTEDFGHYRLLWLTIMTVIGVAPLAMPQSLYYFLPRSTAETRPIFVRQTFLYILLAATAGAWVVSPFNPLQPPALAALDSLGVLVPCLVIVWVTSRLLDILPTIEERVSWQAGVTMLLSALRVISLAAAAWLTRDLMVVLWTLFGLALFKLLILLGYIAQGHGLRGRWVDWSAFVGQFRHAAPFGLSSALFSLRAQADQWVVATLFAIHSFAAFSVAAVLGPMVNLFRLSINHAFLPTMSRLQAAGNVDGMLELNSRANVLVGQMVYPLLAFAFVFAEELITVVYTESYLDAAPVMRCYVFSMLAMVVELASITLLLKEGVFAMRLNLSVLGISVALSALGALFFGLPGAAAGSVLMIYVDRLSTLKMIARRVDRPLAALQDWRTLALLMAFAAAGGLLAWLVVGHYLNAQPPLVRLLCGAAVIGAIYLPLKALCCGIGRHGVLTVNEWKT